MPKPTKIEWIKIKEKKRHMFRRKRNLLARLLQSPLFRQRIRDGIHKELKRMKKHEIIALKDQYE